MIIRLLLNLNLTTLPSDQLVWIVSLIRLERTQDPYDPHLKINLHLVEEELSNRAYMHTVEPK